VISSPLEPKEKDEIKKLTEKSKCKLELTVLRPKLQKRKRNNQKPYKSTQSSTTKGTP